MNFMSGVFSFCAAVELIQLLMDYNVQSLLLQGLVKLLRPTKEDLINRPEILDGLCLVVVLMIGINSFSQCGGRVCVA